MKHPKLSLGLVAAFFAASSAFAQVPVPVPAVHHSLSFDAAVTGTGGASNASTGLHENLGGKPLGGGWSTSEQQDFSSNRKRNSGISLSVSVRNLAPTADQAKLEWYFIGKPVEKENEFIFDSGSKEVALQGGGTQTIPLESKELASHEEKKLHIDKGVANGRAIPPSASTKKTGSKVAGWMLRLVADGQVLQVRASSPVLESLGRNDAQLASFPRK